jgi:tetratricopeptide (TPR) repeat protein
MTAAVLALAILAAHAAGSHQRNRVWRDDESLWRDVTQKSPRNGRGLMNYGLALMRQGKLDEALDYFNRAKAFTPNYSILEINLGIVKSALGQDEEAEQHYRRALQLDPDYGQGHYYYARWLVKRARGPEAIAHLRTALRISPGDIDARLMLMRLHAASGDEAALAALVEDTLQLAPAERTALAFSRGEVPLSVPGDTAEAYAMEGRRRLDLQLWIDAAILNRRAVKLDPQSAVAWNNLGWALGQLGFYKPAVACFRTAYELDPEMTVARYNMIWASERAGP